MLSTLKAIKPEPGRSIYAAFLFLFVALMLLLSVAGCSLGPKYDTLEVQQTKMVYPTVPKDLTDPEYPERPIPPEAYLALHPKERENYLTDYSIKLIEKIKLLNAKLKKIKELVLPPTLTTN